MSFVFVAQLGVLAQRAAQPTSWKEMVQLQKWRWTPLSVCGLSGLQRRKRCVRMRASSPQIPSSKEEVERDLFISSSSLKKKSAPREKLGRTAKKGLSVYLQLTNRIRNSCCVHDKRGWAVSSSVSNFPNETNEVNGQLRDSCVCLTYIHQQIKRLHARNTAMLYACLFGTTTTYFE